MKIADLKSTLWSVTAATCLYLALPFSASAHCDTMDGPVIQDAKKAIAAKDVTPVLKWVRTKDEKAIRASFKQVLSARPGTREAVEKKFFATLVKVHRAGEGAPFTGLKPAGSVEPAIAEADKALAGGSADQLVKLVIDDVAAGIRKRYQRAAAAYQHKDASVAQGREFVEAYVDYTHYVERLHQDAVGHAGHGEPAGYGPENPGKKARHDEHH